MINSVLSIHFIEFLENIIESLNYKKRGMEPRSDKNRYHRILFLSPTHPYCLNCPIECIFPLRNSHAKEKNFHK